MILLKYRGLVCGMEYVQVFDCFNNDVVIYLYMCCKIGVYIQSEFVYIMVIICWIVFQ